MIVTTADHYQNYCEHCLVSGFGMKIGSLRVWYEKGTALGMKNESVVSGLGMKNNTALGTSH